MRRTHNSVDHINAVALTWIEEKRDPKHWDLSLHQISTLLGGVSPNTYKSWLKKASEERGVELKVDIVDRLSLLLGIHKAIALSSPKGHEHDFWNRPVNHPIFQGQSIKEKLITSPSILTFDSVRKYLESRAI
ncbi:hypothetical protein MED121_18610 [Marinomonas sp. MED121]|uniref:hypothetical protein n=1 Tax=Marinomonas sp. MED121 TaxID=314277 RepID=UPI0000690D25|nr:hypothetical protein [Marinomonas sp. MED121]EAQ65281.1 hypothetical protein MED121_18610 [Marinomonas sp. MED121]